MQKHWHYHSKIALKYDDTFNGWTLVLASAWENYINAAIRGVQMLLSPPTLKSFNNIERIIMGMMYASFNGNLNITIVSSYSPTETI